MVVAAIIAVLASIAVPRIGTAIRKANEATTKSKLSSLRRALQLYLEDHQTFPADLSLFLQPGNNYINGIMPIFTGVHGNKTTVNYVTAFDGATDSGGLGYATAGADWGKVWVQCTHTDARSSVWTTY